MKLKTMLIASTMLISTSQLFAQKYANSQFTLFEYNYEIDDKVKLELSPLESYIKLKAEKGQEPIEAMIVHTIYGMVSKYMEDSLGTFFLPVNTFTDKTKYDAYGYPDMTIQKAIRLGDTKYFLKINFKLENDTYDNSGNKISSDVFNPKATVCLLIYNKYGFEPIQTVEGIASSVKPIKLAPEFLSGMNLIDQSIKRKESIETLHDILYRATFEAVYKLNHRKSSH